MPLASSDNAVGRHGHASCIMVHVPWPWNVVVWLAAGARPAGGEKGGDLRFWQCMVLHGPCASGSSRQNHLVLVSQFSREEFVLAYIRIVFVGSYYRIGIDLFF